MGLSELHKQHARKYFSDRNPHSWNWGRFAGHCRQSTELSDAQIGNAYRTILHEIKMGGDKQQSSCARELLLEEKQRLERKQRKQQKKQNTIIQVGNIVAGSVQGGNVIATGHTATQKQAYKNSSPVPDFPEFDGTCSESDLPPTEILSSSAPNSTHSVDESFRSKTTLDSFCTVPSSPDPGNAGTNAAAAAAPETRGQGRQDQLRIELLQLDVEFLKRRNAMLEERIDDLMRTVTVMQQRLGDP